MPSHISFCFSSSSVPLCGWWTGDSAVPAVKHLCCCQLLAAPTDSSALHITTFSTGKREKTALEGFLLALKKPALPLNPLLCEDSAHCWGLSGEVAQWQGGGLNQSRGETPSPLHPVCRLCSFPRTRAQETQRSAPCTLPWPGVVFLCRSGGHGGQNCAVAGAVRVEISLLIDSPRCG